MKIHALGIALASLCNPAAAQQVSRAPMKEAELAKELAAFVDELAAADRFSGAVLLARGDDILWQKAYGQASKRFDVPNRLDTKFNLGSMNKMFTGVAICQLAQAGLLDFQDSILEHLPDYPNRSVAERVTIHQLLTHTSGLGSYWNERFEATWVSLRTVADLLPLFVDDPLEFDPGTRFGYSNSGPVVLGLIIEKLSGQSYYDYVREHIFEPAGMTDTDSYAMDRPVPNLAIGYTKVDGEWHNNLFQHTVKGGPAGGGFSTVGDLMRFARALQDHELLSPEMTATLLEGKIDMGPGAQYAYLFGDHVDHGFRFHGHNGGAPGINGELSFYPDLGYTLAVLSNYDRAATEVARQAREWIAATGPRSAAIEAAAEPPYVLGIMLGVKNADVFVEELVAGGAAERAGLLAGDRILAMNGTALTSSGLMRVLDDLLQRPDPIAISVSRAGVEQVIRVSPEKRSGDE